MELFSIINEPAVLGTALFVTALASVWPLPINAGDIQPTTLFSKAALLLVASYIGLAVIVALALHVVRTTDLSGALLLGSCYVLVSIFTLERVALQGSTVRHVVPYLFWRMVAVSVTAMLLWWWPW